MFWPTRNNTYNKHNEDLAHSKHHSLVLLVYCDTITIIGSNPTYARIEGYSNVTIPIEQEGSQIVQLCQSKTFAIVLFDNGKVYGCGSNANWQLGQNRDNVTVPSLQPFPLNALVVSIACTSSMSALMSRDGTVYLYGSNLLGDESSGEHMTLISASNIREDVVNMVATEQAIHIATRSSVYSIGHFGSFSLQRYAHAIQLPPNSGDIKKMSAGSNHIVILTVNGLAFTAGDNEYGQLGKGDTISTHEVHQIHVGSRIVDIEAKFDSTMLVDLANNVYVFGAKVVTGFAYLPSYKPSKVPKELFKGRILHMSLGHESFFVNTDHG